MAGYYDEEEYGTGPYRPSAAQFDTMNMGPGPKRVEQFDTANLGPAPHRVPQFDTMNLGAPVRAQEPVNSKVGKPTAGDGQNAAFSTERAPASGGYTGGGGGGGTPMNPALVTQPRVGSGGRMPTGLVIASLCLRAATVVTLIIGVAILASDSEDIAATSSLSEIYYVKVSFTSFSATKYALAAGIIGVVYSIYETVSVALRLAMGHLLLPGRLSLFVSYIGDQVVIVLLLTGASAAAAVFNDLSNLISCTTYCNKGGAVVAMMFLGSFFLGASLVISSYCFYRRKT